MSRHGRAGLLSDLIPPLVSSQSKQTESGKGKQKEAPKSEEVRRLEELKSRLANFKGSEIDPKRGCFCQGMSVVPITQTLVISLNSFLRFCFAARDHTLSSYSPMCERCGLILCNLNLTYYVCPHCSSPLHSPEDRDILIAKVEKDLDDTLQKEAEERERAAQEARNAEGLFPALPGTKTPSRTPSSQSLKTQSSQPPQPQSYKVLSLNPKSKKVILTTRVKATSIPASVQASQSKESLVAEPRRIPPPPPEVPFSTKSPDQSRPWAPVMRLPLNYVPPATLLDTKEQKKSTRSPRGA